MVAAAAADSYAYCLSRVSGEKKEIKKYEREPEAIAMIITYFSFLLQFLYSELTGAVVGCYCCSSRESDRSAYIVCGCKHMFVVIVTCKMLESDSF